MEEEANSSRRISSLFADSHKLVVCTPFEIAILPLSLWFTLKKRRALPEAWRKIETEQETYYCENDVETWHCYRPLDSSLVSRWDMIRDMASYDHNKTKISGDSSRWDLERIAADLSENPEKELALLEAARYEMPVLSCFSLSWRFLVFVSSGDGVGSCEGHENLNVYDAIADIVRTGGNCLKAKKRGSKQSVAQKPGIEVDLCSKD